MIKRVFNYLFYGIGWGCTCFVVINCIGVIIAGNDWLKPVMDNFLAQALGSVFVGICCATSAIVYTFEKLARWKQIAIHFAVGLTGYIATAYKLMWIPVQGIGYGAIFIIIAVLIFTAIWFCFYMFNKQEAKKMNARLKELEKDIHNK